MVFICTIEIINTTLVGVSTIPIHQTRCVTFDKIHERRSSQQGIIVVSGGGIFKIKEHMSDGVYKRWNPPIVVCLR